MCHHSSFTHLAPFTRRYSVMVTRRFVPTYFAWNESLLWAVWVGYLDVGIWKEKGKGYFYFIELSTMFTTKFVAIDLLHKCHNVPVPYPTMHHLVTEMCTCVHISVTKWCIVGYGTGTLCVYISVTKWCIVGYLSGALWDLWDGSIPSQHNCNTIWCMYHTCPSWPLPHCSRVWRLFFSPPDKSENHMLQFTLHLIFLLHKRVSFVFILSTFQINLIVTAWHVEQPWRLN